jgi:hypothetical protein
LNEKSASLSGSSAGVSGPLTLIMMDADSGKVVQSFPISVGVDAVAFEPDTGLVFVSTRDGRVHVYHEDLRGLPV